MGVDISIVIVSWNAKRFLVKCLESIERDSSDIDVEITVVDNASTDGSPEEVEKRFPEVRLIRNAKNLGFAKANNMGIRASTGRYVALINSDVEVLSDCLSRMMAFMDTHASTDMLGPRILWSDRTLQSSCRKFPTLWNNFCPAVGLSALFPRAPFFSGEHMLYFTHDITRKVDVLVGCFMMVRREALEAAGLLDESFFIYAEDIDWCRSFRNARREVSFHPGSEAIHHGRSSSSNAPLRFAIEQEKAVLRYWKKHHCFPKEVAFRSIRLLHHALRIGATSAMYLVRPSGRESTQERLVTHIRSLRIVLTPLSRLRRSA
ncbi:MAG: glycosyltransferase family 2 protein [Syntrophorhabdales bacterium]